MKHRIIHIGDMQLEIRNSGKMAQRYGENAYVMQATAEYIKTAEPDIVVIAGDIYQYNAANGDETKMFSKFLHDILPYVKAVRIMPGNHDVKQRNNSIIEDAKPRNVVDFIDVVVSAVNSPKIKYYKTSKLYVDTALNITWAVWSQLDKWSAEDPPAPYSPWEQHSLSEVLTDASIELYHDPIRGSLNFDGNIVRGTDDYGINYGSFRCNTVLAGDIHSPMIYQDDKFTFTYCSSLIQRNFGEGDYYDNERRRVEGNRRHGLNDIIFDTDANTVESIEFVPVKNIVGRHTIQLSENFNYDFIDTLQIVDEHVFNDIRIVANGNGADFIKHSDVLIKQFKDKYNCNVALSNNTLSFAADHLEVIDDTELIASPEKILELAKKYIDIEVDKTSMINDDMRTAAKRVFIKLFEREFAKIELETKLQKINLVSADISNFMTFGNDQHIDFTSDAITRIIGSNAVGKTTLAYFVSWMYNDMISTGQDTRGKATNYTAYFNDRSESDVVTGRLTFDINGDVHVLEKTLTRKWKYNKPMHFVDNWRSYLSGTPSVQMSITSNEFSSTDTEEITQYIRENVITLDKFFSMMFINQNILDTMIHRKPELLNQSILKGLGLNFFDVMLKSYDVLRDTVLGALRKPSASISDYMQMIEEHNERILSTTEQITIDTKLLSTETNTYDTLDTEKTALLTSLNNVREIPVIETALINTNALILAVETDVSNTESEITALTETAVTSVEAHQKDVTNIEKRHAEQTSSITLIEQQIASQEQRVTDMTQNLKDLAVTVYTELSANVREIQSQIDEITLKKSESATQQAECQSKYLVSRAATVERLAAQRMILAQTSSDALQLQSQKTSEKTALLQQRTDAKNTLSIQLETLAELQNSTHCITCKRKYDDSTVAAIDAKILIRKNEINDSELSVNALNNDVIALVTELKNIEQTVAQAYDDITKFDDDRVVYPEHVSQLADPNRTEFILSDDEVALTEKYCDLINSDTVYAAQVIELTNDKESAVALNKENIVKDQRIIDKRDEITVIKDAVTDLQSKLDTGQTHAAHITDELITANTLLTARKQLDEQLMTMQKTVQTYNEQITEHKQSILTLQDEHAKSIADVVTNQNVTIVTNQMSQHSIDISRLNRELAAHDMNITQYTKDIDDAEINIADAKKYSLMEAVLKLYKRMMSKTGLPQYVFEHIVPILNSKLNEVLDNVDFKLAFDTGDLSLKMIDLSKNVVRPITFASGMESTILGLSLTSVIRLLNTSTQYGNLFIDELSGKLNDGEDLPYTAEDYKKVFTAVINRISTHTNIIIVDHVIKDLGETRAIIVERDEHGSSAKMISVKSSDDLMAMTN